MKALTVVPGKKNSFNFLDVPEPEVDGKNILCKMMAVGICGTDFEIAKEGYGEAPPNSPYLIIGHESLGKVLKAPTGSKFKEGDLLVGIVRRPDPVPCACCAVGEWDMCENGRYTERGIKGLHGFASEKFVIEDEYAVKINPELGLAGVLLEPTSVVAKAWQQSFVISSRNKVPPKRALITGAGPVGLLAAMMGHQRGLEVHVLDRAVGGPKPDLVRELGGTYHTDLESLRKAKLKFDITLECTGAAELIFQLIEHINPNGILCLAGISSGGRKFPTDIGALNFNIVLQNELIFGSVNANRQHYKEAADGLAKADRSWLNRLITRKVPMSKWATAFEKQDTDIKVLLVPELS